MIYWILTDHLPYTMPLTVPTKRCCNDSRDTLFLLDVGEMLYMYCNVKLCRKFILLLFYLWIQGNPTHPKWHTPVLVMILLPVGRWPKWPYFSPLVSIRGKCVSFTFWRFVLAFSFDLGQSDVYNVRVKHDWEKSITRTSWTDMWNVNIFRVCL